MPAREKEKYCTDQSLINRWLRLLDLSPAEREQAELEFSEYIQDMVNEYGGYKTRALRVETPDGLRCLYSETLSYDDKRHQGFLQRLHFSLYSRIQTIDAESYYEWKPFFEAVKNLCWELCEQRAKARGIDRKQLPSFEDQAAIMTAIIYEFATTVSGTPYDLKKAWAFQRMIINIDGYAHVAENRYKPLFYQLSKGRPKKHEEYFKLLDEKKAQLIKAGEYDGDRDVLRAVEIEQQRKFPALSREKIYSAWVKYWRRVAKEQTTGK